MAPSRTLESARRLIVMIAAGAASAVLSGVVWGWEYAPTTGWAVACAVYITWVWIAIARMDGAATKQRAQQEDPTTAISELMTLIAAVASIGAVILLIVVSRDAHGVVKVIVPLAVVVSVALSWTLIHTLFTLRYARLYFSDADGGVDFNQSGSPRYVDFAYLSFTIGMTYQVSDTDLTTHAIRSTALRQGLLSYLFGAVILASVVNLIAGIAG
ncbi:DUF1345 domain-containing protein [Pseudolysinimonas sp.]|uniref:DUF1345 domain-containing protein n=1 Tax=Pseudolysinimonas sp. TaxID=2680009 RepID=UPI003F809E7F